MQGKLPRLYFRVRENGAQVFRIDGENRHRRLEMEPLAVVNVRNGQTRPQGKREILPQEQAEIEAWIAARRVELAQRARADVTRLAEQMNLTAQWVQSGASDEEIAQLADALLLAMHDLRGALVRRRADALMRASEGDSTQTGTGDKPQI